MDFTSNLLPPFISHLIRSPQLIPYAILGINFILFKLLRSFVNRLLAYYLLDERRVTHKDELASSTRKRANLVKVFADELISTCELCADCAELNVVYEMHGSLAYGFSLFILTILWMNSFGEAHTTPGYLVEDYCLVEGNQLLLESSTYARFLGQSIAMPLAWRFASLYWQYQLIGEHKELLRVENCKSALSTSTWLGFLVEFGCCLLCRLVELIVQSSTAKERLSQRILNLLSSFISSLLVVLSLELSGGYFNPILAASLEFGCRGASLNQHALVFWLGPLLGHLGARLLFRRLNGLQGERAIKQVQNNERKSTKSPEHKRVTRSSSSRRKRAEQAK